MQLSLLQSTIVPPLPERMRPSDLDTYKGQEHILGPGKPFRKLIEEDAIGSIILWGPPGTGKTTLARIIAKTTKKIFKEVSAVSSGVADIKKIINGASQELKAFSKQTILFIDEVHRFNKTQQDAVLPYVENGTIRLIGSTTENPSFQIIAALRSRCQIFRLKSLSFQDIKNILTTTIKNDTQLAKLNIDIDCRSIDKIIIRANGDARFALNALEAVVLSSPKNDQGKTVIIEKTVDEILQQSLLAYDKVGDEHYNHASAFQKSLRGSDPDAAIYWLGKMIAGGEDPRFIARRLLVTASEDVGNANPQALLIAVAAADAAERLGFPEARIPLSQATLYIATSPKSNTALVAIDSVLNDVKNGKAYPVPDHLKDSHYADAKKYGFGDSYKYPHDFTKHYVQQTYLPDEIKDTVYYRPGDMGEEKKIKEWLKKRNE